MRRAAGQVAAWLSSPSASAVGEAARHWQRLVRLLDSGHIQGPRVHDARLAAICLEHGIGELWTADRDFGRFPKLRVQNPLVSTGA